MEDEYSTKEVPPVEIILFPDLMDKAWKWGRLVPYNSCVGWTSYMKYLKDFYNHFAHTLPTLDSAAGLCLASEEKYLGRRAGDLTDDERRLSKEIQERAHRMMGSDQGESAAAAAGFVCISEEAELMSELLACDCDSNYSIFCNIVRKCALDLMLYKGSESVAAAAVMMGMAKEAKLLRDMLYLEDPDSEIVCDV